MEFAQTQTNNNFNHKTRDRCDSKRHHLKNTKTNETDKVNNKETTAAPVMTVAKVTTTAQVITAMTPREVSTPTATTADVLVNDDNNIIASSVAPPFIAELQGYEAFKNQQKRRGQRRRGKPVRRRQQQWRIPSILTTVMLQTAEHHPLDAPRSS